MTDDKKPSEEEIDTEYEKFFDDFFTATGDKEKAQVLNKYKKQWQDEGKSAYAIGFTNGMNAAGMVFAKVEAAKVIDEVLSTNTKKRLEAAALDALDVVEKELRKDTLYFSRALARARSEVKKKHGGE